MKRENKDGNSRKKGIIPLRERKEERKRKGKEIYTRTVYIYIFEERENLKKNQRRGKKHSAAE